MKWNEVKTLEELKKSDIFRKPFILKGAIILKDDLKLKTIYEYFMTEPLMKKAIENYRYYYEGKGVGYIKSSYIHFNGYVERLGIHQIIGD